MLLHFVYTLAFKLQLTKFSLNLPIDSDEHVTQDIKLKIPSCFGGKGKEKEKEIMSTSANSFKFWTLILGKKHAHYMTRVDGLFCWLVWFPC